MSNPLATYLHDHLAGSAGALDLLRSMREEHAGTALGALAAQIAAEIEGEREVLEAIAERIGPASHGIKEAAAWVAGKASRVKLRQQEDALGTFESLEALALGIHGKTRLWRVLLLVREHDARLRDVDLEGLLAQAERQHAAVEDHRLEMARRLFIA